MSLPKRIRRNAEVTKAAVTLDTRCTSYEYVVIGGGVAGVSCAQELSRQMKLKYKSNDKNNPFYICVIAQSDILKLVCRMFAVCCLLTIIHV